MPAWLVVGSWFLLQVGYSQGVGVGDGSLDTVAYIAHVVGFVVGLLLTVLFVGYRRDPPAGPSPANPTPRKDHTT